MQQRQPCEHVYRSTNGCGDVADDIAKGGFARFDGRLVEARSQWHWYKAPDPPVRDLRFDQQVDDENPREYESGTEPRQTATDRSHVRRDRRFGRCIRLP